MGGLIRLRLAQPRARGRCGRSCRSSASPSASACCSRPGDERRHRRRRSTDRPRPRRAGGPAGRGVQASAASRAPSVQAIAGTPGVAVAAPGPRAADVPRRRIPPLRPGLPPPVTVLGIDPAPEPGLHDLALASGEALAGADATGGARHRAARPERRPGDRRRAHAPGRRTARVTVPSSGSSPATGHSPGPAGGPWSSPLGDGAAAVRRRRASPASTSRLGRRHDPAARRRRARGAPDRASRTSCRRRPTWPPRSAGLDRRLPGHDRADRRGRAVRGRVPDLQHAVDDRDRAGPRARPAAGRRRDAPPGDRVRPRPGAGRSGWSGRRSGSLVGFGLAALMAWYLGSRRSLVPIDGVRSSPAAVVMAVAVGSVVTLAAAARAGPPGRADLAGRGAPADRGEPPIRARARLRWLVVVFVAVAVAGLAPLAARRRAATTASSAGSPSTASCSWRSSLTPVLLGAARRLAALPFRLVAPARGAARPRRARPGPEPDDADGRRAGGRPGDDRRPRRPSPRTRAGRPRLDREVVPGDEIADVDPARSARDERSSADLAAAPGSRGSARSRTFDLASEGVRLDAAAVVGARPRRRRPATFVGGDRAAALAALDAGGVGDRPGAWPDASACRVGDDAGLPGRRRRGRGLRVAGIVERTIPGAAGEAVLVGWPDATERLRREPARTPSRSGSSPARDGRRPGRPGERRRGSRSRRTRSTGSPGPSTRPSPGCSGCSTRSRSSRSSWPPSGSSTR